MTHNHNHIDIVRKLVKIQLTMGLTVVVIIAALKHNVNSVFSCVVGLFLAVIPTIIYAKIAFSNGVVWMPGTAYARHKKAMIARFMLNLLLFAVVVVFYRRCDYIALIVTYCVTLSGYWISLVKQ